MAPDTSPPEPSHLPVVIVGGGVMGAAAAWFLAHEHGARVTVLERDASYARASSALSACAIRQQFSTAINIRLSQESLHFYRSIGDRLAVGDDVPHIGLVEPGYLYLAATEQGAQRLREQQALQRAHAVHTALLEPDALRARFPWLDTDGLTLGSLGLSTPSSGEGWFDGYAAMQAFRRAAIACGVTFVEDEAIGFEVRDASDRHDARDASDVHAARDGRVVTGVRTACGETLPCDAVVLAAGAWSASVAERLGVSLPVRARKRDVFAIEADTDLRDAPLVIDPSGVWFRPEVERGRFLCGAPPRGDDADDLPLDAVDHGLFDEVIWPALAARVPAFDALRVTASWAGYYEMNTFDHNGLVGPLPGIANGYTACGFSGHGLQQAPAVGRALAERIATGAYRSLDLTPLRVERIVEGAPVWEQNVI
jgi:glycine/D-amino acid oxidase-like deaminating enzyme